MLDAMVMCKCTNGKRKAESAAARYTYPAISCLPPPPFFLSSRTSADPTCIFSPPSSYSMLGEAVRMSRVDHFMGCSSSLGVLETAAAHPKEAAACFVNSGGKQMQPRSPCVCVCVLRDRESPRAHIFSSFFECSTSDQPNPSKSVRVRPC